MDASRHVPNKLKRELLQEAGYRCSVTTCKSTSALQFEHVEDWANLQPKRHEFDKMIVLCATCHARVTSREISKEAIKAYKRNLALVNARYSPFEVRLLEAYWKADLKPAEGSTTHLVHDGASIPSVFSDLDLIHMGGLIRDGLVSVRDHNFPQLGHPMREVIAEAVGPEHSKAILGSQNLNQYLVMPTHKALEFIEDYFGGREIE